jgi:hypothetical protein
MENESMLGKWDGWYKNVNTAGPIHYGDEITYRLAGDFMADIDELEDWGCGNGGFRKYYKGKYVGIDGSASKFTDIVADLRTYRSNADGILVRHILEHNYDWKTVLQNAVASFNKKLCIIFFTPFVEETKEIAHNKKHGVDVPDIAFNQKEIEKFFEGLQWRVQENIKTRTGYRVEHIYFIEKTAPKIAVLSANLGGVDQTVPHVPQSLAYDNFPFTDRNFPLRTEALTPRMQAKIPKMFGWQLRPGYDYYLWIDGNLSLSDPESLKYFYDHCRGYDIVTFKHPMRNTIREEAEYTMKKIKQHSKYVSGRYANEFLQEQYDAIAADKNFTDDLLVCGGIFMYRNTPEVQMMLKEWWYHTSRYTMQEQFSFPYVLKKSGIKINVRQDAYNDCRWLKLNRHKNQ